jgi:hypothetical protein
MTAPQGTWASLHLSGVLKPHNFFHTLSAQAKWETLQTKVDMIHVLLCTLHA